MKKIFLISFTLLFFFACDSISNSNENAVGYERSNLTAEVEDNPKSITLLPICKQFYNEVCITHLASPEAVLDEKGYYVLDLASHKELLQKTGIFTEGFITMQDIVFDDCKRALEKDRLTPEDIRDGGLEMNDPSSCSFSYAYYLNSQEYPESFQLMKTSVKNNTAFTEMHFYSGDQNWDKMVYLSIWLKEQNGAWYIDKVEKKQ